MKRVAVVQFSTGAGSAEAAYRAVDAHPEVVLLTADTTIEDEDNWRFAKEVAADIGSPEWVILRDGRNPMQVGRDRSCIPSNWMKVCSQELKTKPMRAYIEARWTPEECVILLGYDWTEGPRIEAALPKWAPYQVECPLAAEPFLEKPQVLNRMRERGIEPPRLYATGAPHANCGGGCVRSGQAAWKRLLDWNPERYREWEAEEEESRAFLGKDVAILKHRSGPQKGKALTLRDFRLRLQAQPSLFDPTDEGACGCTS